MRRLYISERSSNDVLRDTDVPFPNDSVQVWQLIHCAIIRSVNARQLFAQLLLCLQVLGQGKDGEANDRRRSFEASEPATRLVHNADYKCCLT